MRYPYIINAICPARLYHLNLNALLISNETAKNADARYPINTITESNLSNKNNCCLKTGYV